MSLIEPCLRGANYPYLIRLRLCRARDYANSKSRPVLIYVHLVEHHYESLNEKTECPPFPANRDTASIAHVRGELFSLRPKGGDQRS